MLTFWLALGLSLTFIFGEKTRKLSDVTTDPGQEIETINYIIAKIVGQNTHQKTFQRLWQIVHNVVLLMW